MQPVDSLARAIRQQYTTQLSPEIVDRSEQFGIAVAAKIYQWSLSDGGHEAYQRNFPKDYIRPQGTGVWVPPLIGQSNTKQSLDSTYLGDGPSTADQHGNSASLQTGTPKQSSVESLHHTELHSRSSLASFASEGQDSIFERSMHKDEYELNSRTSSSTHTHSSPPVE